jgi:hypothetical protein
VQSFSWRELLFSTSGLYGLWLMYHVAEWFWTGHALTASTGHIERMLAQAALGFAFVLGGVIHTVRLARTQERLRAEMIAELRASRTLPSADPLESLGENIQVREREKVNAASRTNGE